MRGRFTSGLLALLLGLSARAAGEPSGSVEPAATLDAWVQIPKPRARGPIREDERAWWAFQPLRPGCPPAGAPGDANAIDAWVRAGLASAGRTMSAPAEPRVLVRRMTLDLTGLPPEPEAVEGFEREVLELGLREATGRLADRLLASPAYGERWARLWLDLVRYAESDGYRVDDPRPNAWRYRDWVIAAANADLPFDEFVQAQLAGDELWPEDPVRARVATSYFRHGIYEYNNRDARGQWQTILNDITDVTADVFLGVSLQCARCHDHKYDPLLQKDYFRLQAFFAPLVQRDDLPVATAAEVAAHESAMAAWRAKAGPALAAIEEIEARARTRAERGAMSRLPEDVQELMKRPASGRTPLEERVVRLAFRQVEYEWARLESHVKKEDKEPLAQLRAQLAAIQRERPKPLPGAMTISELAGPAPEVRMPKGECVEPGFLSVLDPGPAKFGGAEVPAGTSGRRTALARWMTSRGNPLVPRVISNRVWQQHFGTGLVASGNDFGLLGERPSHPELLDWLSQELVESGWSLKRLHRLIVTSAAYGQAGARLGADGRAPDTRRLEGYPLRRLDAEQLRDSLLAVSGELRKAAGGPAADSRQPVRSVYTKVLRNTRDALLGVFDSPEQFCSTARRNMTTTPLQALHLMNSRFVEDRARAVASWVAEREATAGGRVELAYRRVLGRSPTAEEQGRAVEFLGRQAGMVGRELKPGMEPYRPERRALADLCHVLLNSNEFLHVD